MARYCLSLQRGREARQPPQAVNEKGVKRNEFYQASAQGYRPELCVEIRAADYKRETHIEYDGIMYRIIRTYPVKNECLELICQSLISDG